MLPPIQDVNEINHTIIPSGNEYDSGSSVHSEKVVTKVFMTQHNTIPYIKDVTRFIKELPVDFNLEGIIHVNKSIMINPAIPPVLCWCLCTSNSYKTRKNSFKSVWKNCFGVYCCSKCNFKEKPTNHKTTNKKKGCVPAQSKHQTCPVCVVGDITLITCNMSVIWKEQLNHWTGEFVGKHAHPVPPHSGRLPDLAQQKLDEFFKVNGSESVQQMILNKDHRSAISIIHPSLHNMNKIHYLKKKAAYKFPQKCSIGDAVAYFTDLSNSLGPMGDILKSNSVHPRNAHLTMIDHEASQLIASNNFPFQTDYVHDFIDDSSYSCHTQKDDEINVTFTSTFDGLLQRAVPVVISIMFGKTSEHYKAHFMAFFKCQNIYKTYKQFLDEFSGNTCDFSDAERSGFFLQ